MTNNKKPFTSRVSAKDLGDSLSPKDYVDGPDTLRNLKALLHEAVDSLDLEEAMTLTDFITNHLEESE